MSRSKDYRLSKEKLHKSQSRERLKKFGSNDCCVSVGINARTRTVCSCWMCGNPRNHNGNGRSSKKIQELKQDCSQHDAELYENSDIQ